MVFSRPLTWRCDVCHEDRPDAAISVHSYTSNKYGVLMTLNIKYCNDSVECTTVAQTKDRL